MIEPDASEIEQWPRRLRLKRILLRFFRNKFCLTRYLMALCIMTTLAAPCLPNESRILILNTLTEQHITVRHQTAVVEELVLSPEGTRLWHSILTLSQNLKLLTDVEGLAQLFDLTIAVEKTDEASNSSYIIANNNSNAMLINSVSYGSEASIYDKQANAMQFSFEINLRQLCISVIEARRVFGNGNVQIPSHGAELNLLSSDVFGFDFSEAYGSSREFANRAPLIFFYAPSGCIKRIKTRISI